VSSIIIENFLLLVRKMLSLAFGLEERKHFTMLGQKNSLMTSVPVTIYITLS